MGGSAADNAFARQSTQFRNNQDSPDNQLILDRKQTTYGAQKKVENGKVKGKIPASRDGHSAVVIKD